MKKKVVPTLRQEVKVKVDIVTSDDIKIYYTRKFQDFSARYIIKKFSQNIKTSPFNPVQHNTNFQRTRHNTLWEKGGNVDYQHFFFFQQCCLPYQRHYLFSNT